MLNSALTYSDYGKFDPFLFDSDGRHPNGKRQLFEEWGYTVDDARWLQAGIERQAREKYISGDYSTAHPAHREKPGRARSHAFHPAEEI